MRNSYHHRHRQPQRAKGFSIKPSLFFFTLGIIFLSLPVLVGFERLMAMRSARGGSLGEGAIIIGLSSFAFGVFDLAIRFIGFLLRRAFER